jgi:hypothetical protein
MARHLGGIGRDAIATAVVDIDSLSEALRPYAHRYRAPLGDGEAVVRRFLTEAGLPKTTKQAAQLVRDDWLAFAVSKLTISDPEMLRRAITQLTEDPDTRRMLERHRGLALERSSGAPCISFSIPSWGSHPSPEKIAG